MLNIALELMQICSNFFFLFLLHAISGSPAGAFEHSHVHHTKACVSKQGHNCANVLENQKFKQLPHLLENFFLASNIQLKSKMLLVNIQSNRFKVAQLTTNLSKFARIHLYGKRAMWRSG